MSSFVEQIIRASNERYLKFSNNQTGYRIDDFIVESLPRNEIATIVAAINMTTSESRINKLVQLANDPTIKVTGMNAKTVSVESAIHCINEEITVPILLLAKKDHNFLRIISDYNGGVLDFKKRTNMSLEVVDSANRNAVLTNGELKTILENQNKRIGPFNLHSNDTVVFSFFGNTYYFKYSELTSLYKTMFGR